MYIANEYTHVISSIIVFVEGHCNISSVGQNDQPHS